MSAPTVAYSSFLDYVLPDVPGCSDLKALQEIQNACIEFCQKSWVWKYRHPPITVVQNQQVYPFVPIDANSTAHVVIDMWFEPPGGGTRRLFPKGHDTLREMNQRYDSWHSPTPLYYTGPSEPYPMYGYGFQLVPYVDAVSAGTLPLEIALVPTRASSTVPQWLFERYVESIKEGALWKIKASPGKTYSDPASAGAFKTIFDKACKNAWNDAMRDQTRDFEQIFSLARHT